MQTSAASPCRMTNMVMVQLIGLLPPDARSSLPACPTAPVPTISASSFAPPSTTLRRVPTPWPARPGIIQCCLARLPRNLFLSRRALREIALLQTNRTRQPVLRNRIQEQQQLTCFPVSACIPDSRSSQTNCRKVYVVTGGPFSTRETRIVTTIVCRFGNCGWGSTFAETTKPRRIVCAP